MGENPNFTTAAFTVPFLSPSKLPKIIIKIDFQSPSFVWAWVRSNSKLRKESEESNMAAPN